MTGLGGEEWRVQGVPAASLQRIRRCELRARRTRYANILVTGGTESLRAGVVSRIELCSDEARPVHRVTLPRDVAALRASLRSWLGLEPDSAPIGCEHGTLFIEGVLHAPHDVHYLLLQLADRLALGARSASGPLIGPERIAAGLEREPEDGLARSPLIAALLDRVDKLRVDLGPMPQWSG